MEGKKHDTRFGEREEQKNLVEIRVAYSGIYMINTKTERR